MATKTVTTPTNKDEAAVLETALNEYRLTRVEAAKAFLESPEVAAVREALETLLADGLPTGSSAHGNLSQLPGFLDRALAGVDVDIRQLRPADPSEPQMPGAPGQTGNAMPVPLS